MRKKILAASSVTAIAVAIAAPAVAAEKTQLELGGYMDQYFGGVKTINDGNMGGGSSGLGMDRETRIYVTGKTTLDNGLTVGAHINLRGEGSGFSVNTKRQYAYLSGDFGYMSIGEQNGVIDRFAVLAPDSGARNNQQLLDWINYAYVAPGLKGDASRVPTLKAFMDDNLLRLMYITPAFHGFSAGISYAPNAEINRNTGVRVRDQREASNEVQFGIAYSNQFGSVAVKADASVSTTIDGRDRWAYRAGLAFDYAGFTFGGSYFGTSSSDSARGNVSNGSVNHVFSEDLWEVGARYTTGPYGVSATYGQNQSDLGTAMLAQLAGSYKLGPGVTTVSQLFYGESDSRINFETSKGSSTYRNGLGLVSSLILEF